LWWATFPLADFSFSSFFSSCSAVARIASCSAPLASRSRPERPHRLRSLQFRLTIKIRSSPPTFTPRSLRWPWTPGRSQSHNFARSWIAIRITTAVNQHPGSRLPAGSASRRTNNHSCATDVAGRMTISAHQRHKVGLKRKEASVQQHGKGE
jgi:hypothetical protein